MWSKTNNMKYIFSFFLMLFALGALAQKPEARSLDGRKLYPMALSAATQARYDSLLETARQDFEADPDNLDNIIWLGRRTAYLGSYQKAIKIFSKGLKKHPDAPELYRHRGHRYISVRKFDKAIADFQKAAELVKGREIEVEPDGLPNKLNMPLSNLQFNIYYHWGLAHYLKGAFETAIPIYEQCMQFSINDDLRAATADWLYMAYRRAGMNQQASDLLGKISPGMKIIENDAYHKRLLMYKGQIQPQELLNLDSNDPDELLNLVTQGYGVGNWYFYNREKEKATAIFQKIVDTSYWAAFGYIAAEADLYD